MDNFDPRAFVFFIEGITPTAADEVIEFEILASSDGTAQAIKDRDVIRLKVVDSDIAAVDSNNDGTIDMADNAIEDDENLPGKWLQLNNRDYDGDGVPAFADGVRQGGSPLRDELYDSGSAEYFPFVPFEITLPDFVDPSTAVISFNGIGSDNNLRKEPDGTYIPIGSGVLLWQGKREGANEAISQNASRFFVERDGNPAFPNDDGTAGDKITPRVWNLASTLGFTEEKRTVTFFVEGYGKAQSIGAREVEILIDPDGEFLHRSVFSSSTGAYGANILADVVRFTVIDVDVDFGDPVTGIIAEDALSDQREEQIEFARLIPLNDANADAEAYISGGTSAQNSDYFFNDPTLPILDCLDGFDYLGLGATPSQAANNASAKFTPMQIKLSEGIPLDTARIRILYDESTPPTLIEGADPQPAEGAMRIWLKNGDQLRNASDVMAGPFDDVNNDTWYTPEQLGIDASTRSVILYGEGVNPSLAGNEIRVEVDPEGNAQFDSDGKLTSGFLANEVVKANVGKVVATSDPNDDPMASVSRTVSVNDSFEGNSPFAYKIATLDQSQFSNVKIDINARGVNAIGGSDGDFANFLTHSFQTYDAALTAAQIHELLPGVQPGHVIFSYSNQSAVTDVFKKAVTLMYKSAVDQEASDW